MKQKKKLYAVYFVKSKKGKLYYKWDECQKAMKGHDNLFKGFMNEQEAEAWLNSINDKKIEVHHNVVNKKREEQKIKSQSKKYEIYLDQKHSAALDRFLKKWKINVSDYVKQVIELDLMEEESNE